MKLINHFDIRNFVSIEKSNNITDFSHTFEMTSLYLDSHFDMRSYALIEKSKTCQMLYNYFVYITTNENKTTLYIGMTNDIQRRLSQHHFDSVNFKKSFAGKYNCYYLIYYEGFEDVQTAINREKEIKKWRREKKNNLINSFNPNWEILNHQII